MRRACFFIVAIVVATSSFASIPRASMLDRASEDASPLVAALSETRIRASDVLAPFERPAASELTRALRQAYEHPSTTNASGLRCFLSVDPSMDLKKTLPNPQIWNRYSYVLNDPLRYTDPDGREHVNEPGLTKSLADADWSDAPTEVKAAFWIGGGAASLAVGGGALTAGRQVAFESSLLLMRSPGAVLAAYRLFDAMGGDVGGHVSPTGLTGGKLGYLLGMERLGLLRACGNGLAKHGTWLRPTERSDGHVDEH